MKVTGYRIQQALRAEQDRRELAETRFTASLRAFPGEEDGDPIQRMKELQECEERIALFQAAQTAFNVAVQLNVLGQKMSLLAAVKLVGGAGRREKLWRDAAKDPPSYERTRDRDAIVAKRMVPQDKCAELAVEAGRWARALRAAIQGGNAVEISVEMLDGVELA